MDQNEANTENQVDTSARVEAGPASRNPVPANKKHKPKAAAKAKPPAKAKAIAKSKKAAPSAKSTRAKAGVPFDYKELGDKADAAKKLVATFKRSMNASIAAIVEMGKGLAEIKASVGDGYLRWIAAECDFDRRTASNYAAVARAFPEKERWETVSHLKQAVLYKLATASAETLSAVTGSATRLSNAEVLKLIKPAKGAAKADNAAGGDAWSVEELSQFLAHCLQPTELDRLRNMAAKMKPSEFVKAFGEPAPEQKPADETPAEAPAGVMEMPKAA